MTEHESQMVARVQEIMVQRMTGLGAGHDADHVLRVLRSARLICQDLQANEFVVELAAVLHDIGDAKFHDGVERSAEFSNEILGELNVADDVIAQVAHIVDNISFRKGVPAEQLSIEAKIVQDADRLDALGAIGIVRTIEYGASVGQPFYCADEKQKTGVGHFYEKLFKLRDLLNTEPARRLAGQREQFMRQFLTQFFDEVGNAIPDSAND